MAYLLRANFAVSMMVKCIVSYMLTSPGLAACQLAREQETKLKIGG